MARVYTNVHIDQCCPMVTVISRAFVEMLSAWQ